MDLIVLSRQEQQELGQAIQEWSINLSPFKPNNKCNPLVVRESLIQIRDRGYYKAYSNNFYIYCAKRFGLTPDRVNYFINGITPETESSNKNVHTTKSFVYFLSSGELIKIGRTKDIHRRISCIKTMSPLPITLLGFIQGDKSKEKAIHNKFSNIRSHGEWFFKSTDLEAFIRDVCHE